LPPTFFLLGPSMMPAEVVRTMYPNCIVKRLALHRYRNTYIITRKKIGKLLFDESIKM